MTEELTIEQKAIALLKAIYNTVDNGTSVMFYDENAFDGLKFKIGKTTVITDPTKDRTEELTESLYTIFHEYDNSKG